jgi:hypothetical protein
MRTLTYGAISALAISTMTPLQVAHSQVEAPVIEPYVLCARFPLNSVCEDFHRNPVALENRAGESAMCGFQSGETAAQGLCKFLIESNQITTYIEEADELVVLDGEKPTRVVTASTGEVFRLFYTEQTRSLNLVLPPLQLLANLLIPAREFSVIAMAIPSPEMLALLQSGDIPFEVMPEPGTAADQLPPEFSDLPQPDMLMLMVDTNQGPDLLAQIETLTGLEAEPLPEDLP